VLPNGVRLASILAGSLVRKLRAESPGPHPGPPLTHVVITLSLCCQTFMSAALSPINVSEPTMIWTLQRISDLICVSLLQEADICAVFEVESLPEALARPDAVALLHKNLRDCVDLMGVGSSAGAPRGPRDTVAEDTAAVAHAVLDGKDLGDVRCCNVLICAREQLRVQ